MKHKNRIYLVLEELGLFKVVDLPKPKMHFKGFFAWIIWLFIHLISLITYRNRVKTFFNWMIAYFAKDQSLRMIIRPDKKIKTEPKQQ